MGLIPVTRWASITHLCWNHWAVWSTGVRLCALVFSTDYLCGGVLLGYNNGCLRVSPPETLLHPFLSFHFASSQFLVLPRSVPPFLSLRCYLLSWSSSLYTCHHGCWGGLGISGKRRAAEAGDFSPPWRLSHRGEYDWFWHLRLTQGTSLRFKVICQGGWLSVKHY